MIICADDFGLSPDVDRAALDLAARGRVSAVSVLGIAAPGWKPSIEALLQHSQSLDMGLHIVLTSELPLSGAGGAQSLADKAGRLWSFGALLRRAWTGRVAPSDAEREIAAQFGQFAARFGRPPDFVDGHLHVHQFPGVRQGLLAFVAKLPASTRPYVRNTAMPAGKVMHQFVSPAKCFAISRPGIAFRRLALARGIETNTGFAGAYDYRRHRRYREFLARFSASMEPGNGILMAHPGFDVPWRRSEYEALLRADMPCRRFLRANIENRSDL